MAGSLTGFSPHSMLLVCLDTGSVKRIEIIDRVHVDVGHLHGVVQAGELVLVGYAREHQERLEAAATPKLNVSRETIANLNKTVRGQTLPTMEHSVRNAPCTCALDPSCTRASPS
jgi:hypothetical protein